MLAQFRNQYFGKNVTYQQDFMPGGGIKENPDGSASHLKTENSNLLSLMVGRITCTYYVFYFSVC